jgi:hypothetical protein
MKMNPIEPRYRIDGGQTVLYGEARCLALNNRNRHEVKWREGHPGLFGGGAYFEGCT